MKREPIDPTGDGYGGTLGRILEYVESWRDDEDDDYILYKLGHIITSIEGAVPREERS